MGDQPQQDADRVGQTALLAGLVSDADPTPLHIQIATGMRDLILRRTWGTSERLPAEPELAAALGVSRGTLRRAIQTLVDEGLLVQTHGRGTFVASGATEQFPTNRLISIAEEMDLRGVAFDTEVLSLRKRRPPKGVAGDLGIEAEQQCYRLERLRRVDGRAIAHLVNYVREDLCPQLDRFDFRTRRLFDVIEHEYGLPIEGGHRTFQAQVAGDQTARRLELGACHPVLYLSQLVYVTNGEPVEYSDVWVPGDWMHLSAALSRR